MVGIPELINHIHYKTYTKKESRVKIIEIQVPIFLSLYFKGLSCITQDIYAPPQFGKH